ncbi:MAG: YHS domain-containing protein, partial [Candidatus Neomarinimicrobiota bacterium]
MMIEQHYHDPICGMTVTPETAVGTQEWEGTTYGFCSRHCQELFASDPARFAALAAERYPAIFGPGTEEVKREMPDPSGEAPGHTDPVCGMMVDPASAADQVEYEGTTYYFCSNNCAGRFKADPGGILTGTPERARHHPEDTHEGIAYVCPMDPEVRESQPGPCPKCGMALEPETMTTAMAAEYTCPMH